MLATDEFIRQVALGAWQIGYGRNQYIVDVLKHDSAAADDGVPIFVTEPIALGGASDDPPEQRQARKI